jgi:hypothetical protein
MEYERCLILAGSPSSVTAHKKRKSRVVVVSLRVEQGVEATLFVGFDVVI